MATNLTLKQVFTPGGQPSVTYVSREHLGLEDRIEDVIARGFAFNVVTGPTKSGKTVLIQKVLGDRPALLLEGGLIESIESFWNQLAHMLNIADSAARGQSGTAGNTLAIEGSGGVPGFVQGKATNTTTTTETDTSQLVYTNVKSLAVIERLHSNDIPLVIDDFHYIDPAVQLAVVRALKGAVQKGLTLFLVAVPHRAFDPLQVEDEVNGRFSHVEIPAWTIEDLVKIPVNGFEALNVSVPSSTIRRMCADSFGNPLLVQEICSELCLRHKIRGRQSPRKELKEPRLLETYTAMAASKSFPTFRDLARGPEGYKGRKTRKLVGGETADLYQAILLAVARLGPQPVTTFAELQNSLKAVFDQKEAFPRKAEVVSALKGMNLVARSRPQGSPPIEWVGETERLVIIDPFLMFYMRWTFRDQGLALSDVDLT
ncbi:hypothetical protein D3C72_580480 [compost metagenome]